MKSIVFFFIIILMSLQSVLASVTVVFFEHRTKDGRLVPIEEGGHFYHTAIQLPTGQWLNAHPFWGVQIVDDVHQIGEVYSYVRLPINVVKTQFEAQYGKAFSLTKEYSNPKHTYCSKLVADILNIEPLPLKNKSGVGISPDDLYQILKSYPHKETVVCRKLFF